MKRAILVCLLLVVVFPVHGAELDTQTGLDVDTLVKNCMSVIGEPAGEVNENESLEVQLFNWNCGNVAFNGTSSLELWKSGELVETVQGNISLSTDEYRFINASWSLNGTGEYQLRAYTEYSGQIANSTVEKNHSYNYSFTAVEYTQSADASPRQSFSGSGSVDFESLPSLSFASSYRAVTVYRGSNLFIQPTVRNTGTADSYNLSLEISSPWPGSNGYIRVLRANSSVTRSLSAPAPDEPGLHVVKIRLKNSGETVDTMIYIVKVEKDPGKRPVIRTVEHPSEVIGERGELLRFNYTIENSGDAPASPVNTYMENAERCVEPVETEVDELRPGERVNTELVLRARDAVATCNVTVVVTSPSSTDTFNTVIQVQDTQGFPLGAESLRDFKDEVTQSGYEWLLIGALALLNVYLAARLTGRKFGENRCDVCGRTFNSKHGLEVHQGMMHKNN